MSARSEESAVERLRKQAERAIAAAQGRRTVEPLLERIISLAPDGSEASVFAHRHLAEYRIEDHPWRALLHLRKVAVVQPDDDVVHALMGLSHALLANFRAAVGAYRRAIALAQRNPWYHHNLGHLLDVALDQPGAALRHLELAHRAAHPPEHEIGASLAHCLARLGRIDEARELATAAVAAEPRNREHKQLLAWVERGAPEEGGDPRTKRAAPEPRPAASRTSASRTSASRTSASGPAASRPSASRPAASRPAARTAASR
nr:tetratricopeptide repeat protein [Myxococcota bacterium]